MSEPATGVAARSLAGDRARNGAWHVRAATSADVAGVAAGLAQLLEELGGAVPEMGALEEATLTILETAELGRVFVADTAAAGIAGVLAASTQHAIHVPGPYCLIQDLWVDPDWRGTGVGAALVGALVEHLRAEGIERVEVGLPSQRFAALGATESFYESKGFLRMGPRMRLVIP